MASHQTWETFDLYQRAMASSTRVLDANCELELKDVEQTGDRFD